MPSLGGVTPSPPPPPRAETAAPADDTWLASGVLETTAHRLTTRRFSGERSGEGAPGRAARFGHSGGSMTRGLDKAGRLSPEGSCVMSPRQRPKSGRVQVGSQENGWPVIL